ncbi:hypothetical protein ACIQOV_29695 [Kitasatospora sp. NPDC091257]|uniref:hypothetical protein n=1 Tax=Kitasatospora sp. NPDC091257 TaxID=3364084 RepID=UPI0037F8763F
MKKIITAAVALLAASAMTVPAHADNDSTVAHGINAAINWNFTAAAVCLMEVAVVPVLGDHYLAHHDNCADGDIIDDLGG